MTTSESINELAAALAKAQGSIEGAVKDGLNPHFKSAYATLASVWDAARKPLSDNGLAVVQSVSADAEKVSITTMLTHASGQWIRDTLTISSADGRPQSVGSVVSYGRRYQLAAMVGIAPADDDAEAAEGRAIGATVTQISRAAVAPKPPPFRATPNSRPHMNDSKPIHNATAIPEPPPLTDKDIPFIWLLALLPMAQAVMA